MNVQVSLIQVFIFYEFELDHNAAEATKNICCEKSKGEFDHSIVTGPLAKWVDCSPMTRETEVQSQVESYQRLKNGTWSFLA